MAEPKIRDYLHLYLGCDCYLDGLIYKLEPKHFPANWKEADLMHRPILRTVVDLTDAEYLKCSKMLGGASHLSEESQIHQVRELLDKMEYQITNIPGKEWAKLSVYLIGIGVDLFRLIEFGLAVNKTSLKKPITDEKEN